MPTITNLEELIDADNAENTETPTQIDRHYRHKPESFQQKKPGCKPDFFITMPEDEEITLKILLSMKVFLVVIALEILFAVLSYFFDL